MLAPKLLRSFFGHGEWVHGLCRVQWKCGGFGCCSRARLHVPQVWLGDRDET